MQSPFNDNVGGGWGPGSLASGLLQYYNQVAQEGTSKLAGIAGGFIGGGIGGLSASPQPGEAQPSGLSRFMGGGVQGALGEANPEYKKLQAASKSADYFMKAGGDDAYAAMGIHPDEWKTLGARDKVAAVQGYMQQQGAQARMEQVQAQAEERRAKAAQYEMQREEAQAIPAFAAELMKGRQGGTAPAPAAPASPGPMMDWQPGMPWTGGPAASPFDPAQSMTGTSGAAAAPPAGPTTGTTPGAAYSPEEMMGAMSRMGATNPRLGAAMMRVLIPKMMNGETGSGPTAWKSPEGNPYVFMNHTLIPDRPQMDMSSLMGGAPEGYQAVMTGPNRAQFLKTAKVLPESFHSTLDKVTSDIADAQGTLDKQDSEFSLAGKAMSAADIKSMKASAQRRLETAQKRGKATIDRYVTGGYIAPEAKADYYDQLGLSAPEEGKGTKATTTAAPAVNTKAILEEANKAIAAGADAAKVKARLKEKYGLEVK